MLPSLFQAILITSILELPFNHEEHITEIFAYNCSQNVSLASRKFPSSMHPKSEEYYLR